MDARAVFHLLRRRIGRPIALLVKNLDRHNAFGVANAMAFDAFLSLIPLLAVAGWVLSLLNEPPEVVLKPVLDVAPSPVKALASGEFLRLSAGASAIPPISAVVFLYVTSSGISTAMSEFELIFAAPPRRWWQRRLIAAGCVLGSVALIALIGGASIALAQITGPIGRRILAFVVPPVFLVGAITFFFRIAVRHPPRIRRHAITGAVVTVGLWSLLSYGFAEYVRTLARYATLYGSLAAVAMLLFWLWLLSLAMIIGGEVNAQLEGLRRESMPSIPAA